MRVEEARWRYWFWRTLAQRGCGGGSRCPICDQRWLLVDAASIAYDLAVSEDVARRSIAWA